MTESETPNDEEETPHVILAQLKDLDVPLEAKLLRDYGARPVWFLLEMDAELVTVFERLPEDPIPKGHVEAIMGALRGFTQARSDALQVVLGVSDGLHFGFHTDASLDRVREAFEEDGFFVAGTVQGGEIVEAEDEES